MHSYLATNAAEGNPEETWRNAARGRNKYTFFRDEQKGNKNQRNDYRTAASRHSAGRSRDRGRGMSSDCRLNFDNDQGWQ